VSARYQPENRGTTTMLFCLTGDYTSQALNSMRENPNTDRREAVAQLLEAAGGKVIEFYHTIATGPGAQVTFDVPDPAMAPAITSIAVSSGSLQNVRLTRLYTVEEVSSIREKGRQIRGAYKAPGQQ
jgi:uncharacterized protein with GYD domain